MASSDRTPRPPTKAEQAYISNLLEYRTRSGYHFDDRSFKSWLSFFSDCRPELLAELCRPLADGFREFGNTAMTMRQIIALQTVLMAARNPESQSAARIQSAADGKEPQRIDLTVNHDELAALPIAELCRRIDELERNAGAIDAITDDSGVCEVGQLTMTMPESSPT